MNLSSEQIKAILTVAQTLQRNYDILGAPATQNVRNPYPLHKLVIGVLPTRKTRAMTMREIQAKLVEYGYRVPIQGLQQVVSKLTVRGAIASTKPTLAQKLTTENNHARGQMRAYWYPSSPSYPSR